MTGQYPSRHGADYDARGDAVLGDVVGLPVAKHVRAGKLRDEATTLAERLREKGYRTGAFVAGPWLHRGFGLLQGFERKDDAVTGFGGRPAPEVTAAALRWLDEIGTEAPYFLFVNYFDPHAPYEPVGRYAEFPLAHQPLDFDYEAIMRGVETLDVERAAVLRDRYDAEIRDMDGQLGRLLAAVLSRSGGERTLVIITADHGEALGDGGRLGHGFWLSEELTRVPFLVRYPGDREAGTQRDDPIQLVDVPGLVAEVLGLAPGGGDDARAPGRREVAFLELRREPTTALRFGEQYDRDLDAVIRWPEKLVRSDDGSESLQLLSRESLAETEADVGAEGLAALLDAHEAGRREVPVTTPVAAPEMIEALRQLGYIE
jgi:arylsulfatase A-like enzyme